MTDAVLIANDPEIRYIGTLLGDVIRRYGGEALFQAIEAIRRASVDRYRAGAAHPDSFEIESLDLDATIEFVRGFMLFSMLANLVEDRRGLDVEEGGTFAAVVARLSADGIERDAVMHLLEGGHPQ